MTYTIDTERDREGNQTFDVAVCDNGAIIAQEAFYRLESAKRWLEENYPNATEE